MPPKQDYNKQEMVLFGSKVLIYVMQCMYYRKRLVQLCVARDHAALV